MTVLPVGQADPELEKLLSDELDAINHAAIASDDETFSIRFADDDGAPGFYRRHGYQEVGRTANMPDRTAKHHFFKQLG